MKISTEVVTPNNDYVNFEVEHFNDILVFSINDAEVFRMDYTNNWLFFISLIQNLVEVEEKIK